MSLPAPRPGLVIRYNFLWSEEAAHGRTEGVKDRPCAIIVAARTTIDGEVRTIVAPITHQPPTDSKASIEIPPAACRKLGLDEGRHWVRIDELNAFAWPGFDVRRVPGRAKRYDYGMLPPTLFKRVRDAILARQKARKGRIVSRDEE